MDNIEKIHKKLYNLSKTKFIFLMSVVACLILIPFKVYKVYVTPAQGESIFFIILLCALIPSVKTFLYQKCVINLLERIKKVKNNKILLLFLTSVIFSLLNVHNFIPFIMLSILGLILSYSYVIYRDKAKSAFRVTTIIHTIVYIFCIIMINVFK